MKLAGESILSRRFHAIFICTECGYFGDADHVGGLNIKYRGSAMLGIALKCGIKVHRDSVEPKQLCLFETPIVELPTSKRRQHRIYKDEHGVPGNPPVQLNIWDIRSVANF